MSSPRDQSYFPPVAPDNRRRSSSAAAGRYTPREYASTPSYQPSHGQYLDPNLMPFPPAGTLVRADPPYPDEMPTASPHMNMPLAPRRPSAAEHPHFRRDSENLYQEALRRPSYNGNSGADRRPSHDSRRSYQSHHSHHSHHNEDDYRRHRYEDVDDEDGNLSPSRQHHHHHHHHHDNSNDTSLEHYRQEKKDRGEDVARSLGDSMISFFYPLKYLFERRDKY